MRTLLVVVATLLLRATPTWAALGESLASVTAESQRLHGEVRSTVADGFSVHEITAPDGTVVRQFASPSGVVFGVSWRGPFVPDLAQLFGSYFQEYRQAAQSPVRRHGPLVVRTDRLVVETGGHMRAFHGRAWIPGLLPASVSERAVQ